MSSTRKTNSKQSVKTVDFEQSLSKLNQIVEKMENGQLTLEAALAHFEEGITLIKQCQTALTQAEQKIQVLTQKGSKKTLVDFDVDHDD